MSKMLEAESEDGEIVFVTSKINSCDFTDWVNSVYDKCGQRISWSYHDDGVRMIVFCHGDRVKVEAAIGLLMPKHDELFRDAQAKEGVFYN